VILKKRNGERAPTSVSEQPATTATRLSVNELMDRLPEFDGKPVEVIGVLSFELEENALWHFPKAQRRGTSTQHSER
jgi:hypothetical protein